MTTRSLLLCGAGVVGAIRVLAWRACSSWVYSITGWSGWPEMTLHVFSNFHTSQPSSSMCCWLAGLELLEVLAGYSGSALALGQPLASYDTWYTVFCSIVAGQSNNTLLAPLLGMLTCNVLWVTHFWVGQVSPEDIGHLSLVRIWCLSPARHQSDLTIFWCILWCHSIMVHYFKSPKNT